MAVVSDSRTYAAVGILMLQICPTTVGTLFWHYLTNIASHFLLLR